MNKYVPFIFSCVLALVACGSDHQDQTSATATPPPGTGPVKISSSNAFSPLVQDLNKAKQVNNQVQQQAKTNDQSIEVQSTPAASTSQP